MTPSTAYPLSAAREKVAKLYGADLAKALVDNNPRAIVSDRPLPYFRIRRRSADLGFGPQASSS